VTAGLLAAVVTGGAVGLWMSSRSPAPSAPPAVTARAGAAPAPVEIAAAPALARATQHHAPSAPRPVDLRGEIALIDAARDAVRGGAPERALILLRRYVTAYPTGTFRPEAAALRIEALVEKGQTTEARALARDFVAKHPDSPLVERVARLAADPAR
jgi:TolA-binding protein